MRKEVSVYPADILERFQRGGTAELLEEPEVAKNAELASAVLHEFAKLVGAISSSDYLDKLPILKEKIFENIPNEEDSQPTNS